jgi:cytochrome P450
VSTSAPGPRGSLLWGLAKDLQRDQLATFERAAADHGDVVRLIAGPPGRRVSLYLISHPDGVQHVLTGGDAYTKGTAFYQEIAGFFGDGVLTSDGQRWRRQRRTLAPLFTHRRTDHHVAAIAAEARRMVRRWRTAAGEPTHDPVRRRPEGMTFRRSPGGHSHAPSENRSDRPRVRHPRDRRAGAADSRRTPRRRAATTDDRTSARRISS